MKRHNNPMEFISTQKFLLMSPRKIRVVADLIRRMKPQDALVVAPFTFKKAAEPLVKVIKMGMAAAKEKGINIEDLVFKEIQIGEGPRLKRGNPVSRGQWHPIKRRMSHIRIVLATTNNQQPTVGKSKKGKAEGAKPPLKNNGTKS